MFEDTIQLDELSWEDLRRGAQDRIAVASRGEWTHHAPVDPGITLLELYAAQLEQRLYWMDQPSDELQRALLKLLKTSTRPATCASTVLQLWQPFQFTEISIPEISVPEISIPEISIPQTGQPQANPSRWIPPSITSTRFAARLQHRQLQFQTDDSIHLFPISLAYKRTSSPATPPQVFAPALLLAGNERSSLNSGGSNFDRAPAVRLWIPGPHPCRSVIQFELAAPVNLTAETTFLTLLLDLDTPESIAPQWATTDPSPRLQQNESQQNPSVRFALSIGWTAAETPGVSSVHPLRISEIKDGTLGLHRSGIVRFQLPAQELPKPPSRKDALPVLRVHIVAESDDFPFIPRIRQAVPNVVRAIHRVKQKLDEIEVSRVVDEWKKKRPGSLVEIPTPTRYPLMGGLLTAAGDLEVKIPENAQATEANWVPVDSFAFCHSDDRVFIPCRKSSSLKFGNGFQGRIPVLGKSLLPAFIYHWGGGTAGNVNPGLAWSPVNQDDRSPVGDLLASNVVPGTGGQEEETLPEAIRRSRVERKHPCRAVTTSDIEYLCRGTPDAGILRAHVVAGLHPEWPTVMTPGAFSVFVVPDLPQSLRAQAIENPSDEDLIELTPTAQQIEAIKRFVFPRRLITQELFVLPARYVPVEFKVELSHEQSPDPAIAIEVRRLLREFLHPLYGGLDRSGWPFGEPLRPQEFAGHLRSHLEQSVTIESLGIRIMEPDRGFEACDETLLPSHALPSLRSIQVHERFTQLSTGGLQ